MAPHCSQATVGASPRGWARASAGDNSVACARYINTMSFESAETTMNDRPSAVHPSFQHPRHVRFRTERAYAFHRVQLLAAGPVVYGEPWASDQVAPLLAAHLEDLCCLTEDSWPALIDGKPAVLLDQELAVSDCGDKTSETSSEVIVRLRRFWLPAIKAAMHGRVGNVLGVTHERWLSTDGRPCLVVALDAQQATRADVACALNVIRDLAYPASLRAGVRRGSRSGRKMPWRGQ